MAAEQTFDDRLAVLEEHVIGPKGWTADGWLERAEQHLANGRRDQASFCLNFARLARELEEDDDGC
jgi:hypothetical protein